MPRTADFSESVGSLGSVKLHGGTRSMRLDARVCIGFARKRKGVYRRLQKTRFLPDFASPPPPSIPFVWV